MRYTDPCALHPLPTLRSSDLLGATQTMERYLSFILNIVAEGADRPLDPVYTVTGHRLPPERIVDSLPGYRGIGPVRSEEHTSELQSRFDLVCRLLLEKKKTYI